VFLIFGQNETSTETDSLISTENENDNETAQSVSAENEIECTKLFICNKQILNFF